MKSKNPKSNLKTAILRFLASKKPAGYTVSQITRALRLPPKEMERFVSEVISELVTDRKVSRLQGKKFGIPEKEVFAEGILQVTKSGTGYVRLDEATELLIAEKNLRNALHEDRVRVSVFPKKPDSRPEGVITEVLERSRTRFVGVLESGKGFAFMVPDDQRVHRDFYISPKNLGKAKAGDKVIIQMEDWKNPNFNPEGRVIEVLGRAKDLKVQVIAVARGLDVADRFPSSVETEAALFPREITPDDLAGRLDLRSEAVLTIDPEDAKDFDDAVSLKELDNGNVLLGVHIADVSHFVRPGTKLDLEALKRGTSVYLVDRTIPMLPEVLSNNLCSLVPGQDRLTFSAMMEVTPAGTVKSADFHKSVIHSKRRFTYEEVQKSLTTGTGDFAPLLQKLNRIAKVLMRKRFKNGSIDFDSPEAKFRFNEKGAPVEIIKKERLDSHRLIEELMLLANRSVAEFFTGHLKKHRNPALYRVHDRPDLAKLTALQSLAAGLGFHLDVGAEDQTGFSLQRLMEEVKGTEAENVISELAVRSMARAAYSPENIGHFGLAFRDYTHFTSPIRRYPDLIVHRLLQAYAIEQKTEPVYQVQDLTAISERCNLSERKATEAERESVKLMQVEYMKSRIGDVFEAIISGVTQFGLYVEINDLLVEGMISVRDLKKDFYNYQENTFSLVGERTGHTYRLGDHIRVECANANPARRTIDFIPA